MMEAFEVFLGFCERILKTIGIEDWLIQIILAVLIVSFLFAIGSFYFYKFISWLFLLRKQAFLKKDLHPYFTSFEIDKATRYYIPTKYQDTSPAQGEEPGRKFIDSPKSNLLRMFLRVAFKRDDNRFYLILADSGMGKTTFMINLYLKYKKRWMWGRPKYNIRLLPLGNPNTIEEITKIPDQENTILLLDAFDEDIAAIYNYKERLSEILEKVWRFREVVITSRTQFFPSAEEEPHDTGFFKHGTDGGEFYFRKAYVSVFDDWDIWKYLLKRYNLLNPLQWKNFKRARRIVRKSPNLMMRPMLLHHIRDLEESKQEFDFSFQIYEVLIEKWLERESQKPGIKQKYGSKEVFRQKLYRFSQRLAVNMYENRESRGGLKIQKDEIISASDLQLSDLEEDFGKLMLKESEWRSRSLLNRDVDGNYKFSHKSILEYFLAKEASENESFFEKLRLSGMEAANNFLLDMIYEKEVSKWKKNETKITNTEKMKVFLLGNNTPGDGWNRLGNTFYNSKQYEKSLACYQKAITLNIDFYTAWHNIGNVYLRQKNYDRAVDCFHKAISIKKDYHFAGNGLGWTYKDKVDYEKAIECFQKSISIKKDFASPWNGLGWTYLEMEDYEQAIECFQKATSIKKDYADPWNGLGWTYMEKKEYDKAIDAFQKSTSIKKDYADPWNGLGWTYKDKNKYDKAIECFQKSISIEKDFADSWSGLGWTYMEMKNYEKATDCFQKTTSISLDYAGDWNGLGWAYYNLEDYEKAIEYFQKSLSLKNDNPGSWNGLGWTYYNLEDYEKAIEHFQKSLSLKNDNPGSWNGLGWTYYDLKNYEKAVEHFQKSLSLKNDNPGSWIGLGWTYYDLKNYEKAVEHFQKSLSLKNDNPNPWYGLGSSFFEQKKYEKAIESYQESIKHDTNNPEPWNSLGYVYLKMHNLTTAEEMFKKSSELSEGINDRATMNQGHISLLKGDIEQSIIHYKKSIRSFKEDMQIVSEMDEDYISLEMENKNITQEFYQKIVTDLKRSMKQ